jgi:uncharacterized protein
MPPAELDPTTLARELAEADTAVRAGRLAVEIMTWYCPPGTMSRPGRTVSLP